MYHPELTQQRVEEVSRELKQPLYYYSPDYISEVASHLDSLATFDDKGKFKELKRPLLPDESQFIRNERILCPLDYNHWAGNYHRIRDSNTLEMTKFKRNFAQEVLHGVVSELELAQHPVMLQSLKARQLGITTYSGSIGEHRALFIKNTSGVLASSDEDKTWKLSEMFQRSLREMPWWLLPPDFKQFNSGEVFVESPIQNMTISIQHGRQTSGISRGDTVNYFHLSEIPDFDDPEALIDASLLNALHPTELTFGILESTANGRNDYWHKKWQANLRKHSIGTGLVTPIFLPWYMGTDIYPTKSWLRRIPIPTLWTPPEFIIQHAAKAREYVLANPPLWKALGQDWHLPLEQAWWYWITYQDAKAEGELALAKFYSETPANDLEAFQSKLGSVFSIELTQKYQDSTKPPVGVYKLQGEQVPSVLWPEDQDVDTSKEVIPITYPVPHTGEVLKWNLVPVKTLPADGLDAIIIWELPERTAEYGVGLDGAEGKGLDRTVLPVLKKGTPTSSPVQVAELATDKIATLEIWPVWLALLKLYSPVWSGDYTWAMATPEMNRGGDAALRQLINFGWSNYYVRTQLDQLQRVHTQKIGWETTPKSRDQLVQWILLIVKGMWSQINSVWLVDELRDFVVNQLQTKIRLEAGAGSHDDRIFSYIITLICLQGIDIYAADSPQWQRVNEDLKEMLKFPKSASGYLLPTLDPEDSLPGGVEVVYFEGEEY